MTITSNKWSPIDPHSQLTFKFHKLSAAIPKEPITVTNCHALTHQLTSNRHILSTNFLQLTLIVTYYQLVTFYRLLIVSNCIVLTSQLISHCHKLSPVTTKWPQFVTKRISVTSQVTSFCHKLSHRETPSDVSFSQISTQPHQKDL